MLTSEAFIEFVLSGGGGQSPPVEAPSASALPEGFEGFDHDVEHQHAVGGEPGTTSFARRLVEAAGFGLAQLVERNSVIRGSDAVAKYLPDRASYWPKTATRPYQTLLFEASMTSAELLKIPAFRNTELRHLDDLEAALARLVNEALDGFQKGGEGVTADVRKGRGDETLCIISMLDQREGQSVRLVCFGTRNKESQGLETFQITEQTRFWDPQLAREHLGLLYKRQFKKLDGADWQDAFTTTDERKQADKLLEICTRKSSKEHDIQEGVLDLLDIIAKGFGLAKPPNRRRLQAFSLPADHDIGIDPEERESRFEGTNPFGGVTLRDERSRLLGYIVYPLKTKADAANLSQYLKKNNQFHNVLVVYPDENKASLELWQGRERLTGKLRKGQGYKDAADVVNLLSRFFVVSKAKVKNPAELAQELAYRARYLRRLAVRQLEEEQENGPLRNLYNAFKEALVHDQSEDDFADAFAQTLTYGLLTARWLGNNALVAAGERLTRQTAMKHLPPTSTFLTDFFRSVLSVRLDERRGRLLWLVDDLADLLDRIDVTYVFGIGDVASDKTTDPVIHFYEPFLAAYDKELKNKRGVFFTPRPVVSHIVRSAHVLLQTEFGLRDGLASGDTWSEVSSRIEGLKLPEGAQSTDPFVCILDPATGTGTFLFECIDVIERTMKDRWCQELLATSWTDERVLARWNEYVPNHLLPRLYGYELMVASYAVAHLKLSFKLAETGYRLQQNDRIHVYLTNTLEPPSSSANQKLASLFVTLAKEAEEVGAVKRTKKFTVVVGNPPYSVSSWNTSDWITSLVEDYKRTVRSEESQIQSLSNDYIKFLRFGQWVIERSGAGILGMITGHGYLQGTQPRDLRKSLVATFDRTSCLDLHGSIRRAGPDVADDEPVFQIMTGVAIMVGLRSSNRSADASIARASGVTAQASLVGPLSKKFEVLSATTVSTLDGLSNWHKPTPPHFHFAPPTTASNVASEYESFYDLPACFGTGDRQADKERYWATGFASQQDDLAMSFSREEVAAKMAALGESRSFEGLRREYRLCTTDQWSYADAKAFARKGTWRSHVGEVLYRPFDRRWSVLHKHVLTILRKQVMSQLGESEEHIGLISSRAVNDLVFAHCFVTDRPLDKILISSKTSTNAYVFPLYFETEDMYGRHRRPNFSERFVDELALNLGIEKRSEATGLPSGIEPAEVLQFIYAVIHSPAYRLRYGEFLKIDFPRVPMPNGPAVFRALSKHGGALVALHLLRAKVDEGRPAFVGAPGEKIEKISYSANTIWIDKKKTVGFRGVAEPVWDFHIGGYQVCEKWLKDRKGRQLSRADIELYQGIVVALRETLRLMTEIDEIIERHGGWPGAFTIGQRATS